jgi:hypothetical protein
LSDQARVPDHDPSRFDGVKIGEEACRKGKGEGWDRCFGKIHDDENEAKD